MSVGRGRRSVIVWAILAALLVTIAVLEFRDPSSQSDDTSPTGPQFLMPAPLEEIAAIEIATDGNLHRFSRDEQGAWFYHGIHAGPQSVHEHVPDPEMSEKISKFLGGLGRARIERRFTLTDDDAFGVTRPEMIILVYLPDQIAPGARYSVGDIAPDGLSRYVHITDTQEVVSIANYQIRNLQSLIETVTSQPGPPPAVNSTG
jgi:hypothetical protein